MSITTALLLQLSSTELPPELASFDLRNVPRPTATDCDAATLRPNDIVICARRAEAAPDDGRYQQDSLVPRAEVAIGNSRLSMDAEQVELSRGEISQRAMLRLKIPF